MYVAVAILVWKETKNILIMITIQWKEMRKKNSWKSYLKERVVPHGGKSIVQKLLKVMILNLMKDTVYVRINYLR